MTMHELTSAGVFRRLIRKKPLILACLHGVIFASIFVFAFFLRHDFSLEQTWPWLSLRTICGVVAIKLAIFYWLGHCHVSWGRISFNDLTSLIWAATLSMLVLISIESLILTTGRLGDFTRVPRSVFLLDWAGTVLAIGGIRTLWRSIRDELRPLLSGKPVRTAIIVGADEAGEVLVPHLVIARSACGIAVQCILVRLPRQPRHVDLVIGHRSAPSRPGRHGQCCVGTLDRGIVARPLLHPTRSRLSIPASSG
jgi:FlaA1/EpsC-like NDP-sugar epimerase